MVPCSRLSSASSSITRARWRRRGCRSARPRTGAAAGAEGARDRHPLLLAPRELGGVVVAAVAEAHPPQELVRAVAPVLAPQLERAADVLARGQGRHQMEGLEDEADLRGPERARLVLAERGEIVAVEHDAAAGRPVEPGEQAEQRALAAARRAHDRHEAAGLSRA